MRGGRGGVYPPCPGWASGLKAGSLLWRGEGVWGCGEARGEVGESSSGAAREARARKWGGCVCGRMRSRETSRRVPVSGGEGVWGEKLGLGRGGSAKVTVATGRKGSCGGEACWVWECAAGAGVSGICVCRGRGLACLGRVGMGYWLYFCLVTETEGSSLSFIPSLVVLTLVGTPESSRSSQGIWPSGWPS